MNTVTINDLYKSYCSKRKIIFTLEEFIPLVVFFPAFMVVISDGILDQEEWEYLKQLSRFMAKSYKEAETKEDIKKYTSSYLREIGYLLRNLPVLQEDFLLALKSYVLEKPEVKASIVDTIQLFAEASEGTSKIEAKMIDYINNLLELEKI
jgi:hypothetical protein